MRRLTLLLLPLVVAIGTSVSAHHSISGVYDTRQSVTIEGTVTEFRFVNPHPIVMAQASEAGGDVRLWQLEMDNLRELASIGVTRDSLRPGDRVVVTGSRARNGQPGLYVRKLVRSGDGFEYEQVGSSPRIKKP